MSQPSKPDGSDPRVLSPSDDEEQVTVKSSWGGNGKAYHTTECRNVEQMRATREVAKSVAEWKGYHECEVCITEGEYNDDPDIEDQQSTNDHTHPTPTTDECAAFRRMILDGDSPADVAAKVDWGRTSIYRHANGNCRHTDPVDHAPVTYGWHVAADDTETGDADARIRVSANLCRTFREQLLAGETRAALSTRHDVGKSAIASHANGNCNHPPDAHGHPPLAYGWHAVTEGDE